MSRDLFSPDGLEALRAYVEADTLYAFDFDGTLAAITERREDARLGVEERFLLGELARTRKVAVLSGRGRLDLISRLDGVRCESVGNHGLETADGAPGEAHCRSTCGRWMRQLEREALPPGVELEDKGFSISLHYRAASDPEATVRELEKRIRKLAPEARFVGGKRVLNLLPTAQVNKGTALLALMERVHAPRAIYVGDDATDEDVFTLGESRILGVRVGRDEPTWASLSLGAQEEVRALLTRILRFLAERGESR
ncbi:MAG TPA: trehalose-phosphatase [Bdellovibrionota bacterium]|nr:trehalose-phosphatase [Bdellovibrionota bacterium]